MDETFKDFIEKASESKLENLINQLELEDDRMLEDLIENLSSLVV